jgi:5-deoxy-glucuronate isomerase
VNHLSRFVKAQAAQGYVDIIAEDNPYLKILALGKLFLAQGQDYTASTGEYETALVLLSGQMSVSCEGETFSGLGSRDGVFAGKATSVYIPCQSSYTVTAELDAEIAVCKVKAEEKHAPFVIHPEEVVVHQRGKDSWKREVHDIVADNAGGRVHRMILGETFNKPGNWSSYPPHKHDGEFYPEEPNLEEVYHYQTNPAQGFGIQVHYTKDGSIDDAHIIRHGDSFAIDVGYHPVSAAGGYEVYYLWFMAGESGRKLNPYDDPDHKWLK